MKKTLFLANILFGCLFIISSCGEAHHDGNGSNNGGGNGGNIDSIHCKDYTGIPLKNLLDVRLAKAISDNYKADKAKSTVDGGLEDATSVWFSLDELKHYIWAIEDTLMKQGIKPDALNMGMRIYYAKYPDASRIKEYGVDERYASRHTVFMVATYKGAKKNVDFDPWNIGPDKTKPTPFATLLRQTGKTGSLMKNMRAGVGGFGQYGNEGTVLNHGDLAPPPAGEGTFPQDDN